MTASISSERKSSILAELQSFRSSVKRKRSKRELLSLIGKLSFACKVVPAGRIFLRRLIDLSMTVQHLHYRIPITQEAQRDLAWWEEFLPNWSGTSLILDTHWTPSSDLQLYTDASGRDGWGAFWNDRWLQSHWSDSQSAMPIVWKELYAIVCAVHSWGHLWSKQKILFHCDNTAVVEIWRKGSTRDPETMALVRMLYLRAAHHHINVVVTHISGINNSIADSLSRFQMDRFRSLAPTSQQNPDHIPAWPTPCFIQPSNNLFT